MKALFPYIGESILGAIIAENPRLITDRFNRSDGPTPGVFQQLRLSFPRTSLLFDGFSNLDIGLLVDGREVLPIEVKLGRTGLNHANIEPLFRPCRRSGHSSEARVSGNMLAVLNRSFDGELLAIIGDDKLHAEINGKVYPVTEQWAIIARSQVIASWRRSMPPFNDACRFVSLEEICSPLGRVGFNRVVSESLSGVDYYLEWVVGGA